MQKIFLNVRDVRLSCVGRTSVYAALSHGELAADKVGRTPIRAEDLYNRVARCVANRRTDGSIA